MKTKFIDFQRDFRAKHINKSINSMRNISKSEMYDADIVKEFAIECKILVEDLKLEMNCEFETMFEEFPIEKLEKLCDLLYCLPKQMRFKIFNQIFFCQLIIYLFEIVSNQNASSEIIIVSTSLLNLILTDCKDEIFIEPFQMDKLQNLFYSQNSDVFANSMYIVAEIISFNFEVWQRFKQNDVFLTIQTSFQYFHSKCLVEHNPNLLNALLILFCSMFHNSVRFNEQISEIQVNQLFEIFLEEYINLEIHFEDELFDILNLISKNNTFRHLITENIRNKILSLMGFERILHDKSLKEFHFRILNFLLDSACFEYLIQNQSQNFVLRVSTALFENFGTKNQAILFLKNMLHFSGTNHFFPFSNQMYFGLADILNLDLLPLGLIENTLILLIDFFDRKVESFFQFCKDFDVVFGSILHVIKNLKRCEIIEYCLEILMNLFDISQSEAKFDEMTQLIITNSELSRIFFTFEQKKSSKVSEKVKYLFTKHLKTAIK